MQDGSPEHEASDREADAFEVQFHRGSARTTLIRGGALKKTLIALTALIALGGCHFTPQSVIITPVVNVRASNVGNNALMALNVMDERPRESLGTRGVRGVGADLTVQGNLKSIVEKALSDGLARQGFGVGAADNRLLRVEIRNLDYQLIQGLLTGTLEVDISLKAICQRDSARSYEQMYRGHVEDDVFFVQDEDSNNDYISLAVSRGVNSLLRDDQLKRCLAN